MAAMRAMAVSLALAAAAVGGASACPEPRSGSGVEVYPTAPVLPANLLRFYIYFPRPMAESDILDHVALLDEAGVPIDGVFLANSHDLWSPDRQRLTLLLDPGRVKTGLAAHQVLGRALAPGRDYTLSLGDGLEDRNGCPLGASVEHRFTVGEADVVAPAPQDWALAVPGPGTLEPLEIDLQSAHDHLSLAYRLRIHNAAGDTVRGAIALGPDEATWSFTPSEPWQTEPYRVVIDPRLEDLAGNRPGGLFDRPLGAPELPWQSSLSFQPGFAAQ